MRKIFFVIIAVLISVIAKSQDTTYLNQNYAPTKNLDSFFFYKVVSHDQQDTNLILHRMYYRNGVLKSQNQYKNKLLSGAFKTFWPNGNAKRIDEYNEGKLIEGKCFGFYSNDTTYYPYQIMPQFPGGDRKMVKFLRKKMEYPEMEKRKRIAGKVLVSFVITVTGSIEDIKITQSLSKGIDDETIRIIKLMPSWIPGYQDGLPVNVYFTMPFEFSLD